MKTTANTMVLVNFLMLLSVTFTMRSSTNMLMTVVPIFTKYVINADVFFVGLTATLYGIGAMASNIFVNGRISVDKTPKVVFAFLAIMTIGIFVYIFSKNIYEVLILSGIWILRDSTYIITEEENAMKKNMRKAYLTFMEDNIRPSTSTPNIRLRDKAEVYAAIYLSLFSGAAMAFVIVIRSGCTTPMENPVIPERIRTS